ncbi:hypothetical protein D9Q98_006814 [Chlorella vulgaris]|uniref:Uncharacterized protein n=1 Tax=Chlorella vulgaris TaxID=3077 RepID=A0A9D4TIX6_CHLVU|nr:hypothetical protein D9Q98_006814 [Chlorella vulgaris]
MRSTQELDMSIEELDLQRPADALGLRLRESKSSDTASAASYSCQYITVALRYPHTSSVFNTADRICVPPSPARHRHLPHALSCCMAVEALQEKAQPAIVSAVALSSGELRAG